MNTSQVKIEHANLASVNRANCCRVHEALAEWNPCIPHRYREHIYVYTHTHTHTHEMKRKVERVKEMESSLLLVEMF